MGDDYIRQDMLLSIKDNAYAVVGVVAYLLGASPETIRKAGIEAQIEVMENAAKDRNARIVHYLGSARSSIMRGFGRIIKDMKNGASIYSADAAVKEAVNELYKDRIDLFSKNTRDLNEYIKEANRLISDRINNCRDLFPDWLDWEYVRDFIVMPQGQSGSGIQAASSAFVAQKQNYPYGMYCNWPVSAQGNILANDRKFVNLLYRWHYDELYDQSKVSDAGEHTKDRIYRFIGQAIKVAAVVDCENSDPYRLISTFKQLNDEYTGRIAKIILIDDAHTSAAWSVFEQHVGIPVEHRVIDRLLENKSMVDMTVAMSVTREFYQGNTDGFILVASDSDYWTLIDQLPEARFLVMVEREKCSPAMKEKLAGSEIFYCYIDDFYSGDREELKKQVILKELRSRIGSAVSANLYTILRESIYDSRASVTDEEFGRMYQKLKQALKVTVADDGALGIELTARSL